MNLVVDQDFIHDSDGARQYVYAIGLDKRVRSLWQGETMGLRIGGWTRREGGASEDFTTLRLNYDTGDRRHLRSRLSLTQFMGSWSPLVGSVEVSFDGWERWYFEASTQREMVESIPAIIAHDISQTWSGSADYKLTPSFTAVGGLFVMDISDGNRRQGEIARLIYSPLDYEGFNLQLRAKRVDSDFSSYAYFSPLHLQEYVLAASYRKALNADWVAGAQFGAGTQRVDGDNRQLMEAMLNMHGWFTDSLGLRGKASCSNFGGIAVGQGKNGYLYCEATLSLISAW